MADERPRLDGQGVPYRIDALRSMTDDELEQAIRASSHSIGGGDILDEAARRRADHQTSTLVRLTWAIAVLTVCVLILTAILLVSEFARGPLRRPGPFDSPLDSLTGARTRILGPSREAR